MKRRFKMRQVFQATVFLFAAVWLSATLAACSSGSDLDDDTPAGGSSDGSGNGGQPGGL